MEVSKGSNLWELLKTLKNSKIISHDIFVKVDRIRRKRNCAAHEMKYQPSKQEAKVILDATKQIQQWFEKKYENQTSSVQTTNRPYNKYKSAAQCPCHLRQCTCGCPPDFQYHSG